MTGQVTQYQPSLLNNSSELAHHHLKEFQEKYEMKMMTIPDERCVFNRTAYKGIYQKVIGELESQMDRGGKEVNNSERVMREEELSDYAELNPSRCFRTGSLF